MAIRHRDALSNFLTGIERGTRFDTWLWFYLEMLGARFDQTHFYGHGMKDVMANYISISPRIIDDIKIDANYNLIPSEMLEWIGDDERQCRWLFCYLNNNQNNWLKFPPARLQNRNLVVAMIDTLKEDFSSKIMIVNSMRNAWDQYTKNDRIFLWFKGEHEDAKCELASRWISNNDGGGSELQAKPIRSHQELLMYFDLFFFSHEKRLLCLSAVKKSWSQKKYRDNLSGKKQYNFILSDRAINRLDKLAKKYELKRVDVLEILLQMESERGLYVAEKMKILKGLESL